MNYNIKKRNNKDYEKKKVFHGAFTGGFSAGYFNTVGSKEGWKPNENKNNNLDAYMDEDDYNDWAGPKDVVKSFSIKKEVTGTTTFESIHNTSLTISTIGNELLRQLGWRQSTRNAYILLFDDIKSRNDDDDDDDKVQRIPLPPPMNIPPVKSDTFGLGYVDPSLNKTTSISLLQNSNNHTYHNEDGENIYYDKDNVYNDDIISSQSNPKRNMDGYNFEIVDTDDSSVDDHRNLYNNKNDIDERTSKGFFRDGLNQWSKIPSSKYNVHSKDKDVSGFTMGTNKETSNDYKRWPGPNIPPDYQLQVQSFTPNDQLLSRETSFKNQNIRRHSNVQLTGTKQPQRLPSNNTRNTMVITSLVESMNRRFTKSSENNDKKEYVDTLNQQQFTINSSKPSKICTRTTDTWIPNSLLCKRFGLSSPLTSNVTTKKTQGTETNTKEWSDEAYYFKKSILPNIDIKSAKNNQHNDKRFAEAANNRNLKESAWQYNTNERPSMELKKRIYNHVTADRNTNEFGQSVTSMKNQNTELNIDATDTEVLKSRLKKSEINEIYNTTKSVPDVEDLTYDSNVKKKSTKEPTKIAKKSLSSDKRKKYRKSNHSENHEKRRYRKKHNPSSSSSSSTTSSFSSKNVLSASSDGEESKFEMKTIKKLGNDDEAKLSEGNKTKRRKKKYSEKRKKKHKKRKHGSSKYRHGDFEDDYDKKKRRSMKKRKYKQNLKE